MRIDREHREFLFSVAEDLES